jgi:hypothetical protein
VINAAPVAMGMYTARGPPDWHPAGEEVKETAKLVSKFFQEERATSVEDAALGFGLRPTNQNIATTLVSMPTRKILTQNLHVVTRPRTAVDNEMYDEAIAIFKKNLRGPGHWEGGEVDEYKKAMITHSN